MKQEHKEREEFKSRVEQYFSEYSEVSKETKQLLEKRNALTDESKMKKLGTNLVGMILEQQLQGSLNTLQESNSKSSQVRFEIENVRQQTLQIENQVS
jgi:DNA-binding ferritin-like protein (Dps family)